MKGTFISIPLIIHHATYGICSSYFPNHWREEEEEDQGPLRPEIWHCSSGSGTSNSRSVNGTNDTNSAYPNQRANTSFPSQVFTLFLFEQKNRQLTFRVFFLCNISELSRRAIFCFDYTKKKIFWLLGWARMCNSGLQNDEKLICKNAQEKGRREGLFGTLSKDICSEGSVRKSTNLTFFQKCIFLICQ